MLQDNSELIEYLDKRFTKIDEKFNSLIEVFAVKEDIKELHEKIDNLPSKEDFSNLVSSVDSYMHKADTYFQEMLVLARKVDRLEKWIHQIAEKVGLQLEV
jgi:uncharacterized coiled-coil DUF342 family protein